MAGDGPPTTALGTLLATLPQRGRVQWIGVRPARRVPAIGVDAAEARPGLGLTGDRFAGTVASKRQVTLIQAEHLAAVAALLGRPALDPGLVRRNVVIAGINLYALRHARFRVGSVLLGGTGICAPCARIPEALGPGGFNAMRGHGGITARVLEAGVIRVGDEVVLVEAGTLGPEEH